MVRRLEDRRISARHSPSPRPAIFCTEVMTWCIDSIWKGLVRGEKRLMPARSQACMAPLFLIAGFQRCSKNVVTA
jgi:hypothetical protein